MTDFKRLVGYLGRYWRFQVMALLVTWAVTAINLIMPMILMVLVDRVIGLGQIHLLSPLIVGFVILMLFQAGFIVGRDYLMAKTAQHVLQDIRRGFLHNLMRLPLRFFQHQSVGQVMARVMFDTGAIHNLITTTFVSAVTDVLSILIIIVIIFSINWRLTMATIACLPLFVGAFIFFRRRINLAAHRHQREIANVSGELQTILSSIKEIKAYWAYKWQEKIFDSRLHNLFGASMSQQIVQSLSSATISFVGALGPIVVLAYGTREVLNGRLTVGQLVAFNSYLAYVLGPSQRLASLNINIQAALASARRIFEYMDQMPEDEDNPRCPVEIQAGSLQLQGVRFGYDPGHEVLRGIDLKLSPGSVYALVGLSGVGKSTIVDMVLGFVRPQAGAVLLDGHDGSAIDLACLRTRIAAVPQHPVLLKGTVKDNVAFGRTEIDVRSIRELIVDLRIDEFARADSPIGEQGNTLSLGQRQRIGIARALAARPALLILDEAMSGLDSEAENRVWETIKKWMSGRTILVITHRLISITDMQKIFVMVDGKIVEQGTHDTLLAQGGSYARMFAEQFRHGD